jgi:hypothetical protein
MLWKDWQFNMLNNATEIRLAYFKKEMEVLINKSYIGNKENTRWHGGRCFF